MKKRILSLILTAAMLLTLVPVFATTAAAEETYTITYVDAQSGLGADVTQEITGKGLVYANKQWRISGSINFLHWQGSDGNIYTVGQVIEPTQNLTLTAVYGSYWTGYTLVCIATADFGAADFVPFGDFYRLDTTVTLKANGYQLASAVKGYTDAGFTYKNVGGNSKMNQSNNGWYRVGNAGKTNAPVIDYGEIARPGDGTNGKGVPAGYEFSHYILLHGKSMNPISTGYENVEINGFSRQRAYSVLDRAIENNAYTVIYEGDVINTVGNTNGGTSWTYTHDGVTTQVDTGWATNSPLWLIPIFKAVEVKENTTYNANFGENATTNVASLTVAANTFVREGYEFLYWNTAADNSGERYYANDVLEANNMTLYAIWGVAGQVNVTYVDGESVEIVSGATVTAKAAEKYGYTFTGWQTVDTEEAVTYAVGEAIPANCVVTATWKINVYKITFAYNYNVPAGQLGFSDMFHGTLITGGVHYTINGAANKDGGTGGSNTANYFSLVRKGHNFLGWNNQPDGNGELTWLTSEGAGVMDSILYTFLTAEKAQALYDANYGSFTMYPIWEQTEEPNVFITFNANGGSGAMATVEGWDCALVPECTFEAPANHIFAGWTDAEGNTYEVGTEVTASVTLLPVWERVEEPEPEVPAEITLKEGATLILGEEYVTGLTVGMTVAEFLAQFEGEVAVVNAEGEAVTEGAMATGYKVVLVVEGETVDSYTVVVFGDVDGDGNVNVNDIAAIRTHIASANLAGANLAAANADRDDAGNVNVNDIAAVRMHIAGTAINQGAIAE